jgi:uncharacterized membrane protein YccC
MPAPCSIYRKGGVRIVDKFIQGRNWSLDWLDSQTLQHSARTAVAAVFSLLAAGLFKQSEAYWAAITTLIVMQSDLGATLTVSGRRLAGTALGAGVGALLANHFGPNVLAFGAGIFLLGVLCALLGRANRRLPEYLDRTAYRYAGITLAVVMLVVRFNDAWIIALHRFIEVSIGIAVGLVLSMLWPERQPQAVAQSASAER